MKNDSEKNSKKYAPSSLLVSIILSGLLALICYGIGMRLNVTTLSAGGFVGVILSIIAGCNKCYQRGYNDGEKHSISEDTVET